MTTKSKLLYFLAILSLSFACTLGTPAAPTGTTGAPASVEAPVTIIVVTDTPSASPTPEATQSGSILYDDGKDILYIDPNTGESIVLLSREKLEETLTADRSADSYTYGEKKPIRISFSPDYSKALVTICGDLDARYRCMFKDFVYNLESQSGVPLPVPPDAYGVYWQWSPDSSKLAGAIYSYNRSIYELNAFYAVNADGTNLTPLGPVVNNRWQFTWNPNGSVLHPLSYVTNFQSIFIDRTKPEDITLTGLDGNDSLECMSFSPDTSKVVFATRRNNPKNHEWVYVANSDFTEVKQLTEYDIDARYFCEVDWSPDGRFVHMRYEYDTRVETGEKITGTEPRKDKLVNVDTSNLLETPKDLLICGWTPDNNLIYESKTIDGGVQMLNPGNNAPVPLPAGMQTSVLHCPVSWVSDN